MKKTILFLIPVILLLIFILIMNTGPLLKHPWGNDDNVVKYLEETKAHVQQSRWDKAKGDADKLEKAWEKVKKRVQFGGERNEIDSLDISIARLKGFISAQEKGGALAELGEAKINWDDLAR